MQPNFPTVSVLGVDFTSITNEQFLHQLYADSQAGRNRVIVTANPEIVLFARQNQRYARVLAQADYTVPDGVGIVDGAKILQQSLPERITGYDTMLSLLAWANDHQKRVFLLGAKPAVIQKAVANINHDYPNLQVCGWHDGYFDDEQAVVEQIKAAEPDFVFCALGFPKQDYFIHQHHQAATAIWMGVGGSFDVLAGIVKRAPQKWQDRHLEWFHRLLQEPQRFGRMLALPKYLALIIQQRMTGRK